MSRHTIPPPDFPKYTEEMLTLMNQFQESLYGVETLDKKILRKTRNWNEHQYRAEIKRLMQIIDEMAETVDSAVKAYDAAKAK